MSVAIIKEVDQLYNSSSGQVSYVSADHVYGDHRETVYTLDPQSFVAGPISTAGPVVFRLMKSFIPSKPEAVYLEGTFRNTAAAVIDILPIGCQINRIEISVDGQSGSPVQVITGDFIQHIKPLLYNEEEYNNQTSFNQLITAGAYTLSGQPSKSWRLLLSSSLLTKINPHCLAGDVLIYLFWNQGAMITGSASSLSVDKVSMNFVCKDHSKEFVENTRRLILQRGLSVPYNTVVSTAFQVTLTASVQTELQLNFQGRCSALFILLRADATNVNTNNLLRLGDALNDQGGLIDLVGASKTSLLGATPLKTDFIRGHNVLIHTPSNFTSINANKYIYPLFFSEDFTSAIKDGIGHGGALQMNGNTYLRLTPDASFASGSTNITVIACMQSKIVSDNTGRFKRLY